MRYNSTDALNLAELIGDAVLEGNAPRDGETWRRTAISRAYYAVYSEARLRGFEARNRAGSGHQGVQRQLEQAGAPHLAKALNRLHSARKDADYKLALRIDNGRMRDALHKARKLHRDINAFAKGRR